MCAHFLVARCLLAQVRSDQAWKPGTLALTTAERGAQREHSWLCTQCGKGNRASIPTHQFFKIHNYPYIHNINFFLNRTKDGEREGEKHQCVVASHTPRTGDLACNPGMCPRLGIKPATSDPLVLRLVLNHSHTSQGGFLI